MKSEMYMRIGNYEAWIFDESDRWRTTDNDKVFTACIYINTVTCDRYIYEHNDLKFTTKQEAKKYLIGRMKYFISDEIKSYAGFLEGNK